MISIGIDGGKSGAIALIDGDRVEVVAMPIIGATTKAGKKQGRDEYDLHEICSLLREWIPIGIGNGGIYRGAFVTVEKSQPMPPKMPGGSVANFQRGVQRGWEWMLVALGLPYQLVAPVTWQRHLHAGTPGNDTKQRSILAAQRLFPEVDLRRTTKSRKLDDGMAEALLLAEFGMRTMRGGR